MNVAWVLSIAIVLQRVMPNLIDKRVVTVGGLLLVRDGKADVREGEWRQK